MLETRAKLQNQQELLKQQRMAEDKKWFEDLYQEALKNIQVIAKEKGLDARAGADRAEVPAGQRRHIVDAQHA